MNSICRCVCIHVFICSQALRSNKQMLYCWVFLWTRGLTPPLEKMTCLCIQRWVHLKNYLFVKSEVSSFGKLSVTLLRSESMWKMGHKNLVLVTCKYYLPSEVQMFIVACKRLCHLCTVLPRWQTQKALPWLGRCLRLVGWSSKTQPRLNHTWIKVWRMPKILSR